MKNEWKNILKGICEYKGLKFLEEDSSDIFGSYVLQGVDRVYYVEYDKITYSITIRLKLLSNILDCSVSSNYYKNKIERVLPVSTIYLYSFNEVRLEQDVLEEWFHTFIE